ncbi:MAG: NAD(P)H-dependent oxidoreductase, partial [Candidatus Bipolaricaulota bacterium]
MRFVTIYGGPRPRGNTETVLGWAEDALRAEGHEVERFDLARLDVADCTSCYACFESKDVPGCVVEDDAQAIFEAMIASD